MVKAWSVVLGIGLVLLGLAGLGNVNGGTWISWLDFVAALGSFIVAGMIRPELEAMPAGRFSGPALISGSLFVMWIIGLATGSVPSSIVWWNFAFACAYGLLALAASSTRAAAIRPTSTITKKEDREKPRRVA